MKLVRFGSYSSRSTLPTTSSLRRLKSMMRYDCLRPPFSDLPTVKALTGLPLWRSLRSTMASWRRLGVVGLYVLRAMVLQSLEAAGHVDAIAVGKRDDRLLHVLLAAAHAAEGLGLALAQEG